MSTSCDINQTLSVTTPAAGLPVSFDELSEFMRLDTTDERGLVMSLAAAATEFCQRFTLRQFMSSGLRLGLDQFPPSGVPIQLLRPPVQSVTQLTYLDPDGNRLVLDPGEYQVDIAAAPATVSAAYGGSWPSARFTAGSIQLDYVAGFGDDASDVPPPLVTAIKLLTATWFENREAVIVGTSASTIPMSVESILWQWRMVEFR